MAVRSLFLFGVVLTIVLLVCKDTVHARGLTTTANDLHAKPEPAIEPAELKEKKMVIIQIFPQPGFGAYGGGGGFLPGYGGTGGGPINGLGFGGGFNGFGGGPGRNNLGFGPLGLPGRFNDFGGGFNGFEGPGINVPGF